MSIQKPLSERAKRRLQIAAGLLRSQGQKFNCDRVAFYDTIQERLASLSESERQNLKALTDWVEEYETGEPAQ